MLLNDVKVKNAKPKEKAYKLSDGEGMFLSIRPNGSKYWQLKYRFNGKEKLLSLGVYPKVTLKQARNKKDEAKILLEQGTDPSQKKKLDKLIQKVNHENSFENIAREWLQDRRHDWTKKYADRVLRAMEADLFKPIGYRPISELTA